MANEHWTTCWKCKAEYVLPIALYRAAKASERIGVFCPYGHEGHFLDGPTEEDKLRQERNSLRQQMAQRDDEIRLERELREATERKLSAQRGVVTRIKNRVGHGVCPCCSRTFENLGRHMKSKHPEYAKGDVVLTPVNGSGLATEFRPHEDPFQPEISRPLEDHERSLPSSCRHTSSDSVRSDGGPENA